MPAAVKVRVPATVANLGPGFDALGVAVRMHLEIDIEPRRDSIDIMVEGEGAEQLPQDDTNLVIRSMNAFFDHVGRRPPGFAVRVKNPIPLASGLGVAYDLTVESSAAGISSAPTGFAIWRRYRSFSRARRSKTASAIRTGRPTPLPSCRRR